MGLYVYTARATGRIPAWVDGGYHYLFPLKFSFKPHFGYRDDKHWNLAHRVARNVESREDWTGYVIFGTSVYKLDSALWLDSHPLTGYRGEVYAGPMGAEVR